MANLDDISKREPNFEILDEFQYPESWLTDIDQSPIEEGYPTPNNDELSESIRKILDSIDKQFPTNRPERQPELLINGKPIRTFEREMRPQMASPFLSENETLIEVLDADTETVKKLGLTHAQIAGFLQQFADAEVSAAKRRYEESKDLTLDERININYYPLDYFELSNGDKYALAVTAWRGLKYSPFGDGHATNRDYSLYNFTTGASIHFSGLLPHLIGTYGFYEGSVSYRVSPEKIADFAGLTHRDLDLEDPIVMITQGLSDSVILRNIDQVSRYKNLIAISHPGVDSVDIAIEFNKASDMLALMCNPEFLQLGLVRKMITGEQDLVPTTLKIAYGVNEFIASFNQLDDNLKAKIVKSIVGFEFDDDRSFSMTDSYFSQLLNAAIVEVDGQFISTPLAELIDIYDGPVDEIAKAIYKSAGGSYSTGSVQKLGEKIGTPYQEVRLNEDRARALYKRFGTKIDPLIDKYKDAMEIDPALPKEDQAVAFFLKYHHVKSDYTFIYPEFRNEKIEEVKRATQLPVVIDFNL